MRKYIFLDIDGTLFAPAIGSVPESAFEAIAQARKNGHKVFLCTGRSLAEVSAYLNQGVDGFILGAGAMVYAEGKRIYDHPIPTRSISRIKRMIRECGLGYALEGSAGAYCDEKGYELVLRYFAGGETDREKMVRKAMDSCMYPETFGNEENDKIYKVCAYGEDWNREYPPLEAKLEKPYILTKSMELKEPKLCIGEITNGNVTKAEGIDRVLDHYLARPFEAVGIGDSANDIPMLRKCGLGIAMGNGSPEIKKEADWVTDDILDDGLAKALKYAGVIE